jgi:hypothetical protein
VVDLLPGSGVVFAERGPLVLPGETRTVAALAVVTA